MRKLQGQFGFTLLELLIASAMIAVLIFGLSQHIRSGVTIWRRTTKSGEMSQRQRVALSRLRRDLAHSVVFDPRSDVAYGTEIGQLTLPVFEANELLFYSRMSETHQNLAGVHQVRYWCDDSAESSGLWREVTTIAQVRNDEDAQSLERLLPSCQELSIRYAYHVGGGPGELIWRPRWNKELTLQPKLLEVSVYWDNEVGTDYGLGDAKIFSREVMRIPTGDLVPYEI